MFIIILLKINMKWGKKSIEAFLCGQGGYFRRSKKAQGKLKNVIKN